MTLDESALVGSLLWLPVDQARHVRALFELDDLTDDRHKVVVGLVDICLGEGTRPDPAVLVAAARTTGTVPENRRGKFASLVAELYGDVPNPAWAHVYAVGVVEAGVRRRISQGGQRLIHAAENKDLDTTLTTTGTELHALAACIGRIRNEKETSAWTTPSGTTTTPSGPTTNPVPTTSRTPADGS